jgi:ribbon-helix-helix CopG family protein
MYIEAMKRLQIYIEEELDEALGREAAERRTSKAALIRMFVAERLDGKKPNDTFAELVGRYDVDPGSVDDVVYGR